MYTRKIRGFSLPRILSSIRLCTFSLILIQTVGMLITYRGQMLHENIFLFAVPPNIEDYQTSSDVIVREGANVTLTCKATGSPKPSISWKRDDGSMISINKTYSGE